jgi:hypothetical protein
MVARVGQRTPAARQNSTGRRYFFVGTSRSASIISNRTSVSLSVLVQFL